MKELTKLYRTYQSLVTAIAIFLLLVVGFFFGMLPAVRKIAAMRKEADTLNQQVSNLRAKSLILDAVDEETYRKYLAELIAAVPPDQSLTSVFSTVDGLAGQAVVTVTDLTLSKPGQIASESGKKLTTEERKIGSSILPFTLIISGTYDQIRGFFAQVTAVRRIFRVRRFDFTLLDPTNISARISMEAFYSPYVTSVGTVDSVIEQLNEKDESIIQTVSSMPIAGISSDVGESALSPQTEEKENPFEP